MKSFSQFLAIVYFLLATIAPVSGQFQCGNNDQRGTDHPQYCPFCGFFDPYTGNVHREIADLEIWGSTGELPFVWIRYGNSRSGDYTYTLGNAHNWNHSFQYNMTNDGSNTLGQPQIVIHYPEGGEEIFTQNNIDTAIWLPPPAVGKRLFQNGTTFTLQMANGSIYHFEKLLNDSGNIFYQLQDIRDCYQNIYLLTYSGEKKLLKRVTEPAGRYFDINYNLVGGMEVISNVTTSDGRSVTYNYAVLDDGISRWVELVSVNYGDGTKATYSYSQSSPGARPHISHAIDPRVIGPATNMKYVYDPNVEGFIVHEKNGVTGEVMTTADAEANDKLVCYPNGRLQAYKMPGNDLGNVKLYTDGLGRTTQYTYDENGAGFLIGIRDALGHVTTFTRTTYGNPSSITYPDTSTESFTRDNLDLPLTHKDELGRTTTYTRDTKHRVTKVVYPDSTFETFNYNDFSEVVNHKRRNGGSEHFEYDSRGLRTSFKDAEGNITLYTYDSADLLSTVTDARGNINSYKYNERGLITKATNADGSSQTFAYDNFGNRKKMTDELGHPFVTAYDEFKRPISKTDPLNRTTLLNYDLPGGVCGCTDYVNKPTMITSPSGKTKKIIYDVEWQKTSEIIGEGSLDEASTNYEYDLVGNLHVLTDPNGNPWTYEYDSRNRKIKDIDPLGHKTQWTYDKVGNNLQIIRPDGGVAAHSYDVMNRVTQTIDPKSQITKFEYDNESNILKLTDANNHEYDFTYDLLNRKTTMTFPDSSTESYTYDPESNLSTYTNRGGSIRSYNYDNRNRDTLSSWNDNLTPSIFKKYDTAGRLKKIKNSVSTLTYSYDEANELIEESSAVTGNLIKTINYSYNSDGLKSSMTNPDGSSVSYNYTERNQMASVSVNGENPLAIYTYDLNGNRLTKKLENGTSTHYTWDEANRNTSINHKNSSGSFAKFDYGYDNMDRKIFVQHNNDKGDSYSYDSIDQITDVKYNVTDPGGTQTNPDRIVNYDWDALGNRNTVTDNGTVKNYISNNSNQYTDIGGHSLTYTANGNLKTFSGWIYTYDAQDRLTEAKKGSTKVKFFYDALNHCVKRTINGSPTFFYYDEWNIIDERNINDAQIARYINGEMADEILSRLSFGVAIYYHQEALGSISQLTNGSGNVIESYSYDIFGASTIKDGSGLIISQSAFGNRFLFTAREFISEIALYDYRNRIYSPDLGRFLQVDPTRFSAEDINLYGYVFNNVINEGDDNGLFASVDYYYSMGSYVPGIHIGTNAPGTALGTNAPGIAMGSNAPGIPIGSNAPGIAIGTNAPGYHMSSYIPGVHLGMSAPGIAIGTNAPGIAIGTDAPGYHFGDYIPGTHLGSNAPGIAIGTDAPGYHLGDYVPGVHLGSSAPGYHIGDYVPGVHLGQNASTAPFSSGFTNSGMQSFASGLAALASLGLESLLCKVFACSPYHGTPYQGTPYQGTPAQGTPGTPYGSTTTTHHCGVPYCW